ncbi:hypothetical protein HK405_004511 [Cladochytrium tenue]|nr:hypothetical protein HK405_004511 [Cladochytrium tenue]
MTYYEAESGSAGSCGDYLSDTDYTVALNADQYGSGGYCNQQICITYNGLTATATIKDTCPGCSSGDLDATPSLFEFFNDLGVGRFTMSWSFGACSGDSSDSSGDAASGSTADTSAAAAAQSESSGGSGGSGGAAPSGAADSTGGSSSPSGSSDSAGGASSPSGAPDASPSAASGDSGAGAADGASPSGTADASGGTSPSGASGGEVPSQASDGSSGAAAESATSDAAASAAATTEAEAATATSAAASSSTDTSSSSSSSNDVVDSSTIYGAQGLTACQYDMLLQITSVFETSSTTLDYAVCSDIGDGNGYSAGCIQFTTYSGSALKVVEDYLNTNPSSELSDYVSGLESVEGSSDTSAISGFCDAWAAAADDDPSGFGASQRSIASEYYLEPNADLVSQLGLTTAAGVGQIMDCAIQLGLTGCESIASSASATTPASGGDEATYLSAFLTARTSYINALGGAYPATVTRVNSYQHIVDSGNLDFEDDSVEALDNSGNTITVTCSL